MAQLKASNEGYFEGGKPKRRHLALIMWAYSPRKAALKRKTP